MIYRELTHFPHQFQTGQKDVQMFPPVPMVYEQIPAEPLNWEYHVLSIDLREYDLPAVEDLNAMGSQGWMLVGILPDHKNVAHREMPMVMSPGQFEEMLHKERSFVHYYFIRQKTDVDQHKERN